MHLDLRAPTKPEPAHTMRSELRLAALVRENEGFVKGSAGPQLIAGCCFFYLNYSKEGGLPSQTPYVDFL
jgi:hypothetical protein